MGGRRRWGLCAAAAVARTFELSSVRPPDRRACTAPSSDAQLPGSLRGSVAWCAATNTARGATAGLSDCGEQHTAAQTNPLGCDHATSTAATTP